MLMPFMVKEIASILLLFLVFEVSSVNFLLCISQIPVLSKTIFLGAYGEGCGLMQVCHKKITSFYRKISIINHSNSINVIKSFKFTKYFFLTMACSVQRLKTGQ